MLRWFSQLNGMCATTPSQFIPQRRHSAMCVCETMKHMPNPCSLRSCTLEFIFRPLFFDFHLFNTISHFTRLLGCSRKPDPGQQLNRTSQSDAAAWRKPALPCPHVRLIKNRVGHSMNGVKKCARGQAKYDICRPVRFTRAVVAVCVPGKLKNFPASCGNNLTDCRCVVDDDDVDDHAVTLYDRRRCD